MIFFYQSGFSLNKPPHQRYDIKETLPKMEELISKHNLTLLNWKPTCFMSGQVPSLLDLFITSVPNKFSNTTYVNTLASKHFGVKTSFSDTDYTCNQQFLSYRDLKKVTRWDDIDQIQLNPQFDAIFQIEDPELIAS